MDADLVALAEAHGVATWYEDWHRERKDVSAESVIGVLGLLGVDATTPGSRAAGLAAVRERERLGRLPGTGAVRAGARPAWPAAGPITLEHGNTPTSRADPTGHPPGGPR